MSKTWIQQTPLLEALTKAGHKKCWQGGIFQDEAGDVFLQFLSFQEVNGVIQSELRSVPKQVLGKSIGRANETTPLAQAKLELASKMENQRVAKGYAEEGETAISLGPKSMLAHSYKKHGRRLKFPCVHGDTIIETDQGPIPIRDIVDNHLECEVLSYNEATQKMEYRPIIGWFNNGPAPYTAWLDVVPTRGAHIKSTKEHRYKTNEAGWVKAQALDPTIHHLLGNSSEFYQHSLWVGTLLGDSCISVEKRGGGTSYRLIFMHTNKALFNFKVATLGLPGKVSEVTTGFGSQGFRFVSEALTQSTFPVTTFYWTGHSTEPLPDGTLGKRKLVVSETLARMMTPEALALWIADDGCLSLNNSDPTTPQLTLNTQRYSEAQIEQFVEYFTKQWDSTPAVYTDKAVKTTPGHFLRFSTKDTLFILNQLRTLQVQGVEYKFYFPTEGYIEAPVDTYMPTPFHVRKAKSMPPANRYDLAVEHNHNYVANHIIVHNCYAQPKFDGFRMHQDCDNAWSRGNKPFIQHVIQHVTLGELLGDLITDGELQYPGDFNLTQSLVTKYREGNTDSPGSADLHYYIYDLMDEHLPFMHRWKKLVEWADALIDSGDMPMNVELSPTWVINNEEELAERYAWCLAEGYEGLILRNATGIYDCGNRSYDLLKYKPEEDSEFKIVDILEGRGSDEGAVIFRCETSDGLFFAARPAWPIPLRQHRFQEFQAGTWDPRGEYITVKYYELTKTGVPRFPVAKNLRDFDLQGGE